MSNNELEQDFEEIKRQVSEKTVGIWGFENEDDD